MENIGEGAPLLANENRKNRTNFVLKCFNLFAVQVVVTCGIGLVVYMEQGVVLRHYWFFRQLGVPVLLQVVTLINLIVSCYSRKFHYVSNYVLLLTITLCAGTSMAIMLSVVPLLPLLLSTLTGAGIFLCLVFYACNTRYDFTRALANRNCAVVLCCIGVGSISISRLNWAMVFFKMIAFCGVFCFFIVLSTQSILGELGGFEHKLVIDEYLFGTFQLYLSFVGLLSSILPFFIVLN
eukprot:TRINITY_DN9941_c1_g1_i1.p1 TRINITY_DN9941_c1_g1~~TRINITY_DN9941_c1_g1_i1.p1  ORF type:complete len:237 (+),score=29.13 TRINITY_DN9941_c1_g1_i1:136-846(+)